MGPTKIELSYIGKRPERPNSTKMLPPVWMINLSMEKSFTLAGQNLAIRAGVENLLNKNYEIVRGYPLPGRELFFEISVNRRM
jgi:outer membrane cobalamin receptor